MSIDPITDPGVYDGIPDHDYHNDPIAAGSLSSTELRRLADCPARFRWYKDHPQPPKDAFDFGHAAHLLVLGAGDDVAVLPFDSWRTNAAKEARDEARANNATPILEADWQIVTAMAAALRAHPIAAALLDPAKGGKPEQTIAWRHRETVWGRARADWFPNLTTDGRPILTDYKTARDADTDSFARAVANYGYHQQAAWYLEGVTAVTDIDRPAFLFVVQEKDAPYLVNVIELDETALRIGRTLNERAVDLFTTCTHTGEWPGYGPEVELVSLPRWVESRFEEEQANEYTYASF